MSFEELFEAFDWDRGSAKELSGTLDRVLGEAWRLARRLLMNAGTISADDGIYMNVDPEHMGDAAHRIDGMLHQWIESRLYHELGPHVRVAGEEGAPSQLLLDPAVFRHIIYVDALDGSRQAFTLPGGWSVTLLMQQYVGVDKTSQSPRCAWAYMGAVDAEGVCISMTPAVPGVSLELVDDKDDHVDHEGDVTAPLVSDRLVVEEGADFGVTGETTLLAGGYKDRWWDKYRRLREALIDCPSFNTAGGPTARKTVQNSDVVTVQLVHSTLWDGIAPGLIARAGGFVCELGDSTPLSLETVLGWYNTFGYERERGTDRFRECFPVPPYVAGMSHERVRRVAHVAAQLDLGSNL